MGKYDHILTKEFLQQEYINKHQSCQTIADNIGINMSTVAKYIRDFGLQKNRSKVNTKNDRVELILTYDYLNKYYNELDLSLKEISQLSGIDKSTISKYLHSFGFDVYRKDKKDRHHAYLGYKCIDGTYFGRIRRKAKARKIPLKITIEDVYNQYTKQNGVCNISGIELELPTLSTDIGTASIDRIDSNGIYEPNNIHWVHKDVNLIKRDLSIDELLTHIELIVSHNTQYKSSSYLDLCNIPHNINFNLKSIGMRELNHPHIRGKFFSRFRYASLSNNIEFNIDQDFAWDKFVYQNGRCFYSNVPITLPITREDEVNYTMTASLARFDTNKGYTKENTIWCHKEIVFMKYNFDFNYFIRLCSIIYHYQRLLNNV